MTTQTFSIKTLDELNIVAKELIVLASELISTGATVITLTGDLGAGKTALVKEIAKRLDITESITSPTFVVMKQYDTDDTKWSQLIHMDGYRIESLSEVEPLRLGELVADKKNLICIEWPKHIEPTLPLIRIDVTLKLETNDTRTIKIETDYEF